MQLNDEAKIKELDDSRLTFGKMYTLSSGSGTTKSFRVYLGVADECTQVILCKNAYVDTTAAVTTAPPSPGMTPEEPKFKWEMCDASERIVFNLLDNTVSFAGSNKGFLLSPVADFMFDRASGTHKLKLFKALTSSDVTTASKIEEEFPTLHSWSRMTLLSSGYFCTASIETFMRQQIDDKQQIGEGIPWPSLKRSFKLPFFGMDTAPSSELLSQCQDTVQKPAMVAGMGTYITITESGKPNMFIFGLVESQDAAATIKAIQLEVKDPANCDYIQVCFSVDCSTSEHSLDLIFYHRYYVPLDSDRAVPFHVKVTELDTFIFEFENDKIVMKYGSVGSSAGVNWITHSMTRSHSSVPSKIQLIAGRCAFRVARPLSNNLSNKGSSGGTPRSALHLVSCAM